MRLKKMRVLFVEYSREFGGAMVCLYHLVNELGHDIVEPVVMVPERNHLVVELEGKGTVFEKFDVRRSFLHNLGEVVRAAKKHRVDVLHGFDELPSNREVVVTGKLLRKPVVLQLMGENRLGLVDRVVGGQADRMIAVSSAVEKLYAAKGLGKRLQLIHHGIPLDVYRPRDGSGVRERYGIPSNGLVVVNVARLAELKGVDYFLRAAERVLAEEPHAWFMVVGDGPDRRKLEELARELGIASRVVFAGMQEDARPFFAAADVVVQSSTYREALSNVILEAMAMEKAVVATRVGGTPDIIDSGDVGVLVEPKNAGSIAAAVVELLRDERRRMALGKAARKRVEKAFDIRRTAREMETVYREVAGE